MTSIDPTLQSCSTSLYPAGQLGKSIIVLPPSSSTVALKSVPRTAIVALGVLRATRLGSFLAIAPDA